MNYKVSTKIEIEFWIEDVDHIDKVDGMAGDKLLAILKDGMRLGLELKDPKKAMKWPKIWEGIGFDLVDDGQGFEILEEEQYDKEYDQ